MEATHQTEGNSIRSVLGISTVMTIALPQQPSSSPILLFIFGLIQIRARILVQSKVRRVASPRGQVVTADCSSCSQKSGKEIFAQSASRIVVVPSVVSAATPMAMAIR